MIAKLFSWPGSIKVSQLVTPSTEGQGRGGDGEPLSEETIQDIKAEQVELLYEMDRGSGFKPVFAFFVTTWIVAGFDGAMPWAALSLYCAAWVGFHSLQLTFLKSKSRRQKPHYWARQFWIASLCTGFAWGFGSAVWLDPTNEGKQAIVAVVMMGVGASSIIARAIHPPSMIAFMVPAALPVLISLALMGTNFGFVMFAFCVLLIVSLLQWGGILNKWQSDSLALQFRNNALVNSLSHEHEIAETAREAAEAANNTKSEFLATMSHEVRTPLNGILGMARVMQSSDIGAEHKDQLNVIVESGEMLSTVLNDILDLSKLEAGHIEMEQRAFNAMPVVESVLRLLITNAHVKGIDLEIHADTSIKTFAKGDMHRVRQVLLNLIGNAIKFTDHGEITVTFAPPGSPFLPADIGEAAPKDSIVFAITDTGIGVPAKALGSLFDPFKQADQSTTRKYGGTGLGLAICKRLVDHMGGQIGVISKVGEGSTFWFALPAATAGETAALQSDKPQDKTPIIVEPRRILLAEDNDLNARVAEALLSKFGHTITRARDGLEAVAHVKGCAGSDTPLPDVILMDIRMPNMSGKDAARAIRDLGGSATSIPILALTADISAADFRIDGTAILPEDYVGLFDGILTKPIMPEKLNAAIAEQTTGPVRLSSIRPDDPRYDATHLSDLLSSLGAETFADLFETFLNDLDGLSSGLTLAFDKGDKKGTRGYAHDLAGASANLGFVALADAARQLGRAAAANENASLSEEQSHVSSAISDVRDVIQNITQA